MVRGAWQRVPGIRTDNIKLGGYEELMINLGKTHRGNLTVNEDTSVTGILVGNAEIYDGKTLLISGVTNGNIKVRGGGRLLMSGILNGDMLTMTVLLS